MAVGLYGCRTSQPTKVKTLCFFKLSGSVDCAAQCNMPQDQNPQHQHCVNLEFRIVKLIRYIALRRIVVVEV